MSDEQPYDPWSLDAIVATREYAPPRIVIYGTHGIGKTTLFHYLPNHLMLFAGEDGKRNLPIRRFPQVATHWDHITMAIGRVLASAHEGKPICDWFGTDSLDWLEKLVWAETCRRHGIPSIESVGYGKGYLLADEVWSELLQGFDALREAGVGVVLLAHHEVTQYTPPESEPYNRYDLDLHKRARAKIHEWADVVGFAYEKSTVLTRSEKVSKTETKTHTRAGAVVGRFLALSRKPTHEAKNGYGLPDELPLSKDATTANELLSLIAKSFED